MRRIVVIGCSGAGKTTLARELAHRLSIPHIELDALHWERNWTEATLADFRARADAATRGDTWTLDGNYSKVRDIVWARADTIIWLDYPMRTAFTRVLVRTMRRCWTRQELWSGNRERFWTAFLSRDSILLWVLTSWRSKRWIYPREFTRFPHLRIIRLRSQEQTDRWVAKQVFVVPSH
jgi:adenylate kinase family enzyme